MTDTGPTPVTGNQTESTVGPDDAISAIEAASRVVFDQDPTDTEAGTKISPAVTVQLKDRKGKDVAQPGVLISMTISSGSGTLSGTTTRSTDDQGLATFDDLSIDLIGAKRLRASSSGLDPATSRSFDIVLGQPARLQIESEPSAKATAGVPFAQQPVVWVVDAGGNLVTTDNSTVVEAARLEGNGTLQGTVTVTARRGVATFVNLSHNVAGTMTILFRSGVLTRDTSRAVLVEPADAAGLTFMQHPTNTMAGVVITPPVTVRLKDAFGNDVTTSGTPVAITLATGSGILSGTLTRSTASGIATFDDLSINLSGVKTLSASSGSLSAATSDVFTISADSAKALEFIQQPTNVVAGSPIVPPVTVQLQDALGNDVPTAGVSIALQLSSGTGELSGTTTRTTNESGLASFDDLSINLSGQKVLTATSEGLTSALSSPFAVSGAAESELAFVQQPSTTAAGENIAPPVTVQVRDSLGNDIGKAGLSIRMRLAQGSTGTLSGATTQLTDASGLATFSNLSIDQVGEKSLAATASGLIQAQSDPFTVSPAPPSKLVFTTSPSNATAGVAFPIQPVIALEDQFENLVTGVPQDVTIALHTHAGSGSSLNGVTTLSVDTVTGKASFKGLWIDKAAPGYTLTATGSTVSTTPGAVVSDPFTIAAASASQVRVETEDDGSGTLLGTQTVSSGTSIVVYSIARDAFDNFVSDTVATSWLLEDLTGGVVQSDLVPSVDRRSATFTGAGVGSAVIKASVPGLTSVSSGTITVVNNATATRIQVETAANGTGTVVPDQSLPSGSHLTVHAIARDLNGNFVSNIAAENWYLVNSTGGIVSGDLVPSGDRKRAVFTGRLAGATRIRANAGGLIPTPTGIITVTFGSPATVAATAGTPQSTKVGTPFETRFSATVKDSAGNPVAGTAVTFTAPPSGASGTFVGGVNTVLTDGSGVALAPVFTANSVAGSYEVTARVSGVSTPALFSLTNAPRAVGRITAVAGTPQNAQVGTAFPVQFAASVQDSFGNPVNGAEVTFAAPQTGASGNFPGDGQSAVGTTDGSGVATAPPFTANLTVGAYAVTATSPGVASPALFALTNTAGAAFSIAPVAGTPQTTEVNSAYPFHLRAMVKDAYGNVVNGCLVTFTAPVEGASGVFPSGTIINVGTDTNGVADAPLFVANSKSGSFTVVARAAGVASQAFFELTNRPGPVSSFRIEAEVGGALGTQLAQAPFDVRVTAQDRFWNTATGFTGTVDLSSSGALTLGGGTTPPFGAGVLASHAVAVQNAGRAVLFALRTGGVESGQSDTFQVNNPVPHVTGVSPSFGERGQSLSLRITGSGFLPGVTTVMLGNNITTYETVVSDSQITVDLSIGLSADEGPRTVLVLNPSPGGGVASLEGGFVVEGVVYPTTYTLQHTIVFPSYAHNSDFQGTDYRIVGLPGVGDMPISQFLSGSKDQDWVVYWDNGGSSDYLVPFDVTATFNCSTGRAFWLLHRGPLAIDATVPTVPLDSTSSVRIPLHPGWNLISNPFSIPVAWADVQAANEPSVLGGVYTFNSSFSIPDILSPFEGCLYDNVGNISSLVIPFREARLLKQDVLAEGSWRVEVEFMAQEYVDRLASFGVSPGARTGRDRYDYRYPRGVGTLPEAYFSHPEWGAESGTFATDIRPMIDRLETWRMEVRAKPQHPAQLSFAGVASVSNQHMIVLIDDDRSRSVDLRTDPLYRFIPATPVSHFRVVVGREDAVRSVLDETMPKEFALGNNFPNPFNPSTTIPVTVPWRSSAALSVYTILGERVRTLHDGPLDAGRHWFLWDGTNDQGRVVASGVYFIRLVSDSGHRFIRKMVLMK